MTPESQPSSRENRIYNRDQALHAQIVDEWYRRFPDGVTLPPEYAHFVQDNLLRLLIRLARYKFVAHLVKKTDRVIEVGSGSGIGGLFVSQHCAHVAAIEIKTPELEQANAINHRPNVEFHALDFFHLDVRDPYDVMCSLDIIEHMPIEQGRDFVAAMVRRLKPTGMLMIGTPSIYSYPYQSPESRVSHIKCYDQQELLDPVDPFFGRPIAFSMNDKVLHTGHPKMPWYYFILVFMLASPADDA